MRTIRQFTVAVAEWPEGVDPESVIRNALAAHGCKLNSQWQLTPDLEHVYENLFGFKVEFIDIVPPEIG